MLFQTREEWIGLGMVLFLIALVWTILLLVDEDEDE